MLILIFQVGLYLDGTDEICFASALSTEVCLFPIIVLLLLLQRKLGVPTTAYYKLCFVCPLFSF